MQRRHLLLALATGGAWPAVRAGGTQQVLAAAWQDDAGHRVGLLALQPGVPVRELASIEVPSRAHGVWTDAAGRLVAVARRPGDWLLRWAGPDHEPQWEWTAPLRVFNGHALPSVDGRWLYTTENDVETGAGLIGVRDARTLAKHDEWPTGGLDPHQLVWDRQSPGHLLVANGGIATLPETGRVKHDLERMDSSLARIDARGDAPSGRLAGQWRLADPRLGLRHLAWNAGGTRLGVALQAEHGDAAVRAAAPVLAVFDGQALQAVPAPRPLAGYGGDIAASGDGFVVSCPRADGLAAFSAEGQWQGFTPLAEACALAGIDDASLWAGGRPSAARFGVGQDTAGASEVRGRRLDNHWALVQHA